MKLFRAAVFVAAGTFAAFSVAQNAPLSTIEGRVTNSVTGTGIAGASVSIIPTDRPNSKYEATSDAAGHFKITGVTPGNYRPAAEKDGFSAPQPDIRALLNSGFRINPGGDTVKVDLTLTPFHSIAGRVFDPNGKPAAGMEVSISPNIMADMAVTDAEGRFALENIRTGSYTLIVKPPESAKPEEAKDGTRTALVTTYYPSVADRSLAQPILFGAQGDFGGAYEIRMQTAPVHRVRGVALNDEGKPAPGAELSLFPAPVGTPEPLAQSIRPTGSSFALGMRRAPTGAPEATAIAGADGHFEFPAVRSGDWRIVAASDPLRDPTTSGPHGTTDARVNRGDVDDLQIYIKTPFQLTGTIEWDPASQRAADPSRQAGAVTLVNPDGNEFVALGIVESGVLSFENVVPGSYKLIARPGLSTQAFLGGSQFTEMFPVTRNGPPLRVLLKTWSGTVRGTVEKGAGATVVLIPQHVDDVAFGQTAICDATGSFELNEVSPGDYFVASFDHVNGFGPSAAIVNLVPSRGRSVKVEERSSTSVTLTVIAEPR